MFINAVPECPCEDGEYDDEEEDKADRRGGGHGRHDRLGLLPGRRAAASSLDTATAAAAPVAFDYLVVHGGGGRYD